MNLAFKRATRAAVPLKLGISGPSGSGKTTAALRLARGLVGPDAPIALVDTENGSASLYADATAFDVLDMNPPYQVAKFLAAIDGAVQGGYKALIIDSASMEWQELLTEKEALDARGGNSYANWGSITKKHEDFIKAIRTAPIHLLLCLRAKDKHEIQEKDGKKSVVKLGQGSVMRDGFEYELTTVFELAMDHQARVSKDRTRAFDGRIEPITEATGRELAAWLSSGKELAPNPVADTPEPPATPTFEWTEDDHRAFGAMADLAYDSLPEPDALAMQELYDGQRKAQEDPQRVLARFNTALKLPKTPEQNAAALAQMVQDKRDEPAQPVSAEAEAFVEGVSPTPPPLVQKDPKGAITVQQFQQLCDVCKEHAVPVDRLESYSLSKGYLTGKTLSTMRAESFTKLLALLLNDSKRRAILAALNAAPAAA